VKKISILTGLILFCSIASFAFSAPQQLKIYSEQKVNVNNNIDINAPSDTVLTGGVSQIQELPSGMYGMWEVKGTLVETNDYAKYSEHTSDVWILKKDGNFVTLINPQNGASATITVTQVQGNTATFVRSVKTYVSRDAEQVTITLNGDTFTGTDLIVSEDRFRGVTISTGARYKIYGTKISGQSLYNIQTIIQRQY